jgi:hypothetical protein
MRLSFGPRCCDLCGRADCVLWQDGARAVCAACRSDLLRREGREAFAAGLVVLTFPALVLLALTALLLEALGWL